MSANFIRHFVIVATIAMLMAFTVLMSSAYIFLLKVFVPGKGASPEKVNVQVLSELEVTWEIQPIQVNYTSHAENNTAQPIDSQGSKVFDSIPVGNRSEEKMTLDMDLDKLITDIVKNVSDSMNDSSTNLHEQRIKARKDRWGVFKQTWGNSKTFVLIASGLVFLAGLVQFVSSAWIVKNGHQDIKIFKRLATQWMLMNIFVCLVLVSCLSTYAALETDTEKNLTNPAYISELERNNKYFHRGTPHWTVSIVASIYNVIMALDIAGLITLILISACVMNRLQQSNWLGA
ncbi:unnamed protein product [Allacma fusca]|uniref:Uncharacterized protein n=1 Tax=Allacma fusca TaxID=39272 RepID=A0A8J2JF38_9HEXA|nr:unnamed protein product [Allacma fusca]